ncbi:DUF3152 domain-containing protein [Streptomyces fuscichromogenes]|uniref:DUF3152 domain-containing protein n=1 Tax=Streptomyces fuscichromogenes TaxID=1324013 RepID=A0A917XLU0_9ACTN|nr:DUF3152 domain-containing protein [Streptomyces fuscichromogenes]GGN35727.1 hypothetical protein GCM10011578_078090 [Streptomyces fuscichromogenes]
MGRHSRRGPAPKDDPADIANVPAARQRAPGDAQRGPAVPAVPRPADGTPTGGSPRLTNDTPARGVPHHPDGTPAHGVPRFPDGTSAHGAPRFADGTPAHGVPRLPDGTPAHGVPRLPDGTPAHGVPRVRGGHPQQREAGGGWGGLGGSDGAAGPAVPRQRQGGPGRPRQDYVDAFDEDVDVFAPRPGIGAQRAETYPPGPGPHTSALASGAVGGTADGAAAPVGGPAQPKGGKGRTFAGIAAAAVTTVLAVIVAGQVVDGRDGGAAGSQSAAGGTRATEGAASRGNSRTTPSASSAAASPSVATLSYEQAMGEKYPLSAKLAGSGKFTTVPGSAKAPGKGRKYTYRVDVEQGLGLDGKLFAEAVQKTLNDERSWAHDGARTFERVSSGKPDFVITLASPGTTAKWCAKSGLDTTEDNVSCDSASTERVMINAYRWAQGSKTYGDKIHAYRQMLINHEVGHRLGYGHVTCDKDGELAPVMQQQTKFLDHDGIHCLPNPWPYPKS